MLCALWVALFVLSGQGTAQTPSSAVPATPQTASRDAAAKPAAGATVRGRVISATSDQPLHRVRITLNGGTTNPPSAVTDVRGRFEISDVPSGSYTVTAVRAGYLTIQYGQRRPHEAGRPVVVQAGQTIDGLDFTLPRGGVLAGRITDELGDPAAGTRVEALEFRYMRGRRTSVPARLTTTNDAGEYRLSGLDPGSYQIRAYTTDAWESDDGKETYAHVATYFPGVTGTEQSANVNVPLGAEVGGLDFHLIAGRAARIAGVVQDANGAPMPAQVVNLDRITRTVGGALGGAGFGAVAKTDANGAFDMPKLPPGEYIAYTGSSSERVSIQVVVGDGEVKQIALTPRKAAGAAGIITTDDGSTPAFSASSIAIEGVSADPDRLLPVWGEARPAPPRPDWTFTVPNLDGQYVFRVRGMKDDWILKAVMAGDRDITEAPLRLSPGAPAVSGLRIVLSRHGARLRGDVVDSNGKPFVDATVIVFAEDSTTWGPASRFTATARADEHGQFSIRALPPGVYRAIAREAVVDGQWEDAGFLQTLVADAMRVELAADRTESVTLTVVRPR
jgi:protocatechuate 3,4-dioxygenase beta subunit